MLETAASRYQKVQISTSSPGQILLALYNGIFRFLIAARSAFQKGELARGREQLSKAQAIIHELEIALDHQASPELCGNLQGLYLFSIDRIQKARFKGETCWIDEVVRVLGPMREAWATAVAEVQKQSAPKR
jgi:flagellar protein FliS